MPSSGALWAAAAVLRAVSVAVSVAAAADSTGAFQEVIFSGSGDAVVKSITSPGKSLADNVGSKSEVADTYVLFGSGSSPEDSKLKTFVVDSGSSRDDEEDDDGDDDDDDDDNWLEKWLETLELHIPMASTVADTFNFTLDRGVCREFHVSDVYSAPTTDPGFDLGVLGLSLSCTLQWEAHSIVIPAIRSEGQVLASVAGSSVGGPMKVVADTGSPPLPTSLVTRNCEANIDVKNLKFSGGVLSGALELLSGFVKAVLNSQVKALVCQNVDRLLEQSGSAALANASNTLRSFLATGPVTPVKPAPLPDPQSDFAELATNPGVRLLSRLVNGALGNASSPYNLRALLSLALGPHGRFSADALGLLPVSKALNLTKLGVLNATLDAFALEGLNSWSEFAMLTPGLRELGLSAALDTFRVNLSMRLQVVPGGAGPLHGQTLNESFNFSFGVSNLSANGSLFLALNKSRLGALTSDQLASMGCLASATQQALLTEAGLGLGSFQSLLSPASGDDLERDLDRLINLVVGTVSKQFSDAAVATAHHFFSVTLRDLLNTEVERALTFAPACAAPQEEYTSPPVSKTSGVSAIVLTGMAALILSFTCLCTRTLRSQARLRASSEASSEASTAAPSSSESPPMPTGASSPTQSAGVMMMRPSGAPARTVCVEVVPENDRWDSLAYHPRISRGLRWVLPLLVVATMLLFATSNASNATTVMLAIHADGKDVAKLPSLKSFALVSTIKDMLDGKVYGLALLIAFFSGCWPYVKLLMMLGCWFAPTRILSVSRRQLLLDILDGLGKWSLVDMLVMVLFMVAFKFDISTTDCPAQLLEDIFGSVGAVVKVSVYVEPLLYFHVFLIATLSSLVLGHVMSCCHRYAHRICEFGVIQPQGCTQRRRLCDVQRPLGWKGHMYTYGVPLVVVLSFALMLVGILEDSFQFTFEGLAGFVLGEQGRVRPFSVFTLAKAVPHSNPDPDSISLRLIQITFALFTMMVSLAYPWVLLVLWCAPLTERSQQRWYVTAQVLYAWSALDVFVVSIMAGMLEIERFTLSIVGHKCDGINSLLKRLPLANALHGKNVCYDLDAELVGGFWILLVAAVISNLVGIMVMRKCSSALCAPSLPMASQEQLRGDSATPGAPLTA